MRQSREGVVLRHLGFPFWRCGICDPLGRGLGLLLGLPRLLTFLPLGYNRVYLGSCLLPPGTSWSRASNEVHHKGLGEWSGATPELFTFASHCRGFQVLFAMLILTAFCLSVCIIRIPCMFESLWWRQPHCEWFRLVYLHSNLYLTDTDRHWGQHLIIVLLFSSSVSIIIVSRSLWLCLIPWIPLSIRMML